MFDFSLIQVNADNPTLTSVIYATMFSFLLSTLLAFVYERTSRGLLVSGAFIQALVLSSVVSSSIMQAIGDSLARGMGMLGALAIIRFRTSLQNPRNIIFMFASMGIGIACGVYGFNVAFIGTLTFCTVAVVLYFTPYSYTEQMIGLLRVDVEPSSNAVLSELEGLLGKYTTNFQIVRTDYQQLFTERQFKLVLKPYAKEQEMLAAIQAMSGIVKVRLDIRHEEGII